VEEFRHHQCVAEVYGERRRATRQLAAGDSLLDDLAHLGNDHLVAQDAGLRGVVTLTDDASGSVAERSAQERRHTLQEVEQVNAQ
jgi:hypothetical protein